MLWPSRGSHVWDHSSSCPLLGVWVLITHVKICLREKLCSCHFPLATNRQPVRRCHANIVFHKEIAPGDLTSINVLAYTNLYYDDCEMTIFHYSAAPHTFQLVLTFSCKQGLCFLPHLFIYVFIFGVDSWFLKTNSLQFLNCLGAQIVPVSTSGSPIKLAPGSFRHVPIPFFNTSLLPVYIPRYFRLLFVFPAPVLESAIFPWSPGSCWWGMVSEERPERWLCSFLLGHFVLRLFQ